MKKTTGGMDCEKIFNEEFDLWKKSACKIDPITMPLFYKIELNRSNKDEVFYTITGLKNSFKKNKNIAIANIKDRFSIKRIPQYVITFKNKKFKQINYGGSMKELILDLLKHFTPTKLQNLFPDDFTTKPPKGAGATKPEFGKYYWKHRQWGVDNFTKDINNSMVPTIKKKLEKKLKSLNSEITIDLVGVLESRTLGEKYKFENFKSIK